MPRSRKVLCEDCPRERSGHLAQSRNRKRFLIRPTTFATAGFQSPGERYPDISLAGFRRTVWCHRDVCGTIPDVRGRRGDLANTETRYRERLRVLAFLLPN